jgi:O-antigen/teichoic acid export membrane protein
LPGNVISVCISIFLGKIGYGVWSIVGLFLINQIISTVVFWIFIKWNPIWKFNLSNFKFHFNFGYKLLLSAQLNTIFENINNILIGKFYDVKVLAYYDRAYTLNSYPATVLSGIIMKVSLPTLTVIKDESERLQNAYKVIMQIAFFISAVALGLSVTVVSPLIIIVMGDKWISAVPFFQILAISFVFYPLHTLNINILSLFGRSDLFLRLEIIKKVTALLLVIIGFKFGILGLIYSNVAGSILALFINTYYSGQFLNYSTRDQLFDLMPTMFIVIITIVLVFIIQYFVNFSNLYLQVISSLSLGVLLLVILGNVFSLSPYIQLKKIVREHILR